MPAELSKTQRIWPRSFRWIVLFSILGFCLSGSQGPSSDLALKRAVVAQYAILVDAAYREALSGARQLQTAIDLFLHEPSERSLQSARQAWLNARIPYLKTEVCRFYDGPIDEVEGMINAWPIDENYIDGVSDNPDSGIINAVDEFPVLTRGLLSSLNEKEGQKNISSGYHAIEFLLWGQDQSSTGPGDRSWRDYSPGAKNWERRRDYLRLTAELLVEKLAFVMAAWKEGDPDNYRARFLSSDPDVALGRILKGMGVLSGPELAGERLTVAYETKEQEDEHSCFSDNTCNDLVYDAIGIQNVYFGLMPQEGSSTKGSSVHDLLKAVDPVLGGKLAAQIDAAVAALRAIPPPFDQAILGANGSPGRVAVRNAARTLQIQSDLIAQAAKTLQIKF